MDLGWGGREKQSCGRDSCPRAIQQVLSAAHAHSDLVPTPPLAGSSHRPSYMTQSKRRLCPRPPDGHGGAGTRVWVCLTWQQVSPARPCPARPCHPCGSHLQPRGGGQGAHPLCAPHVPSRSVPSSLCLSLSLIHLPDPSLPSPHSSYLDFPGAVDVGRVVARVVGAAKCPAGVT